MEKELLETLKNNVTEALDIINSYSHIPAQFEANMKLQEALKIINNELAIN